VNSTAQNLPHGTAALSFDKRFEFPGRSRRQFLQIRMKNPGVKPGAGGLTVRLRR